MGLHVDITNLTGGAMGGDPGWTTEYARGSISNVTIDGLYVRGGNNSHTMRFDSREGGYINGVTISNFYRFGTHVTDQGGARANVGANSQVSFQ